MATWRILTSIDDGGIWADTGVTYDGDVGGAFGAAGDMAGASEHGDLFEPCGIFQIGIDPGTGGASIVPDPPIPNWVGPFSVAGHYVAEITSRAGLPYNGTCIGPG